MIHRAGDIRHLCLVCICGICGSLCLPLGALAKDLLPDREGTQWAPYLEWSLENASYEGNPFDLLATATFVHEGSGETRTTGMFHDGGATWKFRFTGTRTGRWTFVTSSADPDLNERRGVVTILPHPSRNVPGFVASSGDKWIRTAAGRAFVPQLVMYAAPKDLYGKPEKIDADIRTFLVEHGFSGFHVMGSCHWFDINEMSSRDIRAADPNPDRRTFEALELLITKTHAAGGMVHLWAWGDDQRGWTPTRWGKNGRVDRRLQRTIAARLGPLPGWTMGYGFDNWEWVTKDDLRAWHDYMHRHMGWPHLLGARAQKNRPTQIYEGLDYSSYEQHRPDYEKYVETIMKRPDKPSFSEDRFRIRKSKSYASKDYDMEMTRRGLWHSTMAGGVANIWGRLDSGAGESGSAPYPRPEWIKTWSTFFKARFVKDMTRAEELTDGVCLKRPSDRHFVFYKESTTSIQMNLSHMSGSQPAVAIDARKPYAEIDLGDTAPRRRTWTAPYRSDWAIAVGDFALEITGASR